MPTALCEECATVYELIGLRPILVDDLKPDVVIVFAASLVLIRDGLTEQRMVKVADWVLGQAAIRYAQRQPRQDPDPAGQ